MPRTRVCIYGIRTAAEALAAADAGADAVGFIFHVGSTRFIEPEEAFRVMALLPPYVTTVGVYTDATVERYLDTEELCPTDYSQFHGNEDEDVVRQCGTRAIKTVWYEAGRLERETERWLGVDEVDAVLIGFKAVPAGGVSAWGPEAARAVKLGEEAGKAVMLGGGVTPSNAGEIIRAVRPFALGISEAAEGADGFKSADKMDSIIAAVRAADAG